MQLVVVYAQEAPPEVYHGSIFLAGPTARDADTPSWRPEALRLIEERLASFEGDLVVFVPEPRSGVFADYSGQIEWEFRHMSSADVLLFWVPRDMGSLPGLTTNVEFGRFENSGRLVLGAPPEGEHVKYLQSFASAYAAPVCATLDASVEAAGAMLGAGSRRSGYECQVPLIIWTTPTFQAWYNALLGAGNRFLGGRTEYVRRIKSDGQAPAVFSWIFRPRVWITAEDRIKENEPLFARPDVAAVVAYRRGNTMLNSQVVLVREFRSTGLSADGYVHELPGGSSRRPMPAHLLAAAELSEETGLTIDPTRLRAVGIRQPAATVSAHRQAVFGLELNDDEMAALRADQGQHGNAPEGERTYIEIVTWGEALSRSDIDWTTMGAIAAVLLPLESRR